VVPAVSDILSRGDRQCVIHHGRDGSTLSGFSPSWFLPLCSLPRWYSPDPREMENWQGRMLWCNLIAVRHRGASRLLRLRGMVNPMVLSTLFAVTGPSRILTISSNTARAATVSSLSARVVRGTDGSHRCIQAAAPVINGFVYSRHRPFHTTAGPDLTGTGSRYPSDLTPTSADHSGAARNHPPVSGNPGRWLHL